MKICLIGSGGIALSTAFDLINSGNEVVFYTSNPNTFDGTISEINEDDEFVGKVDGFTYTDDLSVALNGADYAFVTYPAFMLYDFAEKLDGIISLDTVLCVFPGTGGAEFAFKNLIDKGITLAGLQRVPYIARVKEKGKKVKMSGKKSELFLGTIPTLKCKKICSDFENMFSIPCHPLPNYLSVTFTPSNPILHTSRLYSMFKDNPADYEYDRNFLFYEEWNDESSKMLIACDRELQMICDKLEGIDLSNVVSLCDYYESHTVDEMTKKISGIKAFKGIGSPMVQKSNGKWVIDWNSRYFTADFPYGLAIIHSFAKVLGVDTLNIEEIVCWYANSISNYKGYDISEYGLKNLSSIAEYY